MGSTVNPDVMDRLAEKAQKSYKDANKGRKLPPSLGTFECQISDMNMFTSKDGDTLYVKPQFTIVSPDEEIDGKSFDGDLFNATDPERQGFFAGFVRICNNGERIEDLREALDFCSTLPEVGAQVIVEVSQNGEYINSKVTERVA